MVIVDPPEGTFYSGEIVIDYPEDLLSLDYVGWFGNFAADSSQPVPPATSPEPEQTGFYTAPPNTYTWNQGPNPALNASVTNSNGVLTISFNDPTGVLTNNGGDFNLLDVAFTNSSGKELQWVETATASSNLLVDSAQTTFTCVPTGQNVAGACGANAPMFGYSVSPVPEPGTIGSLGLGLFGLFLYCRRRRDAIAGLDNEQPGS